MLYIVLRCVILRPIYYTHRYGAAMGSPVAPIICNLFMENFEQQAIIAAPINTGLKVVKRYVDDIF